MINSIKTKKIIEFFGSIPIFVVKVNSHHQRGLLHEIKAKYLATLEPEAGDEIVEKLFWRNNEFELDGYNYETGEEVVLTSRPYRGPLLGEDGLEDAWHPFEETFRNFLGTSDDLVDETKYFAVEIERK